MEERFTSSGEVKYASVSNDERTLAILCHVLSIFFSFIPALVIYLVKKEESPYVAEHAKEVLNFQISLFIYAMVSVVLILLLIGILFLMLIGFVALILHIIAAVKASDDILYRYPFTIRLIK